jgi:hypothetical protein
LFHEGELQAVCQTEGRYFGDSVANLSTVHGIVGPADTWMPRLVRIWKFNERQRRMTTMARFMLSKEVAELPLASRSSLNKSRECRSNP